MIGITSPQSSADWPGICSRSAAACPEREFREVRVDDPNDLTACFEACWGAFDYIAKSCALDDVDVVAGPTGGTKLMSAALLLAASEAGAKVVYISGERDKGGVGVVKTGTERPMISEHPYDLLARTAKQRLCEEFNSYRFESAMVSCREISERMPEPARGVFSALNKLCDGYRYWELFRHSTARQRIKSGVGHFEYLSTGMGLGLDRLSDFLGTARGNLGYLERLGAVPENGVSNDLVLDLLANAQRRATEGKYDDAVARLYRALEMQAQVAFVEKFGCSTSRFPISRLPDCTREVRFNRRHPDDVCDIGARKAYQILADIDHPVGAGYFRFENEFKDLLNRRNESILAHGTVPVEQSDFERLYDYICRAFDFRPELALPRLEFESLLPVGSGLGRGSSDE